MGYMENIMTVTVSL